MIYTNILHISDKYFLSFQNRRKLHKSSKLSHRTGKTLFLVNLSEISKNCAFLGTVTSILFFCNFLKNAPVHIHKEDPKLNSTLLDT